MLLQQGLTGVQHLQLLVHTLQRVCLVFFAEKHLEVMEEEVLNKGVELDVEDTVED